MINKQLKAHGIMEIKSVLVDASIVDSPFSPDGSITIGVADDREDNLSEQEKIEKEKYNMSTLCSGKPGVDKEGRWVKKGGKYRFGYKKHVATTKEGLVEGIITTPANVSDTREFKDLIDKLKLPETVEVLADKGYASQGNSIHLAEKGLTDKIMKKATRGKPLGVEEKRV